VLVHLDAAYRFARWLCRGVGDADDIVQESVLRAFRAYDTTRVDDPRAWLLAIVRNCQLTAAKRQRQGAVIAMGEAGEGLLAAVPDTSPGPPEQTAQAEVRGRLMRLLGCLPAEQREVLVLRELEELSYREIVTVTSLPIGTVMSRLSRARAALKAEWERHQASGTSEEGSHGML
jgi:RNA polymerase sigma factor (sigma-70 family)